RRRRIPPAPDERSMPAILRDSLRLVGCWRVASVLLLAFLPAAAAAQFATLQGRVTDAATGEALPGATVVLASDDGAERGTAATTDGAFALAGVPPGRYVLRVSFVGYAAAADTLALAFGERAVRDVALAPDEADVGEMVVEGAADEAARS